MKEGLAEAKQAMLGDSFSGFDAAAEGVADLGVLRRAEADNRLLDVAEGNAAGVALPTDEIEKANEEWEQAADAAGVQR